MPAELTLEHIVRLADRIEFRSIGRCVRVYAAMQMWWAYGLKTEAQAIAHGQH